MSDLLAATFHGGCEAEITVRSSPFVAGDQVYGAFMTAPGRIEALVGGRRRPQLIA